MFFIALKVIVVLICVLSIFLLAVRTLSKIPFPNRGSFLSNPNNLRLTNVLYIDNQNKILTIKYNMHEYILLVGKNNILLMDKNENVN